MLLTDKRTQNTKKHKATNRLIRVTITVDRISRGSAILPCPVASLGWVTPGAATEGVTPLFFPEKPGNFFAHRCHYHYRFLLLSLECHPPPGCHGHPTPFLPVQPRFSTILCKFAHKRFFPSGVTPLEGVTRGGPPPPPILVTPLAMPYDLSSKYYEFA